MANILLLNGPNLNLLGTRETSIYGSETLDDIVSSLSESAAKLGHTLTHVQSNAEHVLVDTIQAARKKVDIIIINPAALTHTSVALRDSLLAVDIPFIEMHLSNVDARESFRQHSFLADIAIGKIAGFGSHSYDLALQAAHYYLQHH